MLNSYGWIWVLLIVMIHSIAFNFVRIAPGEGETMHPIYDTMIYGLCFIVFALLDQPLMWQPTATKQKSEGRRTFLLVRIIIMRIEKYMGR